MTHPRILASVAASLAATAAVTGCSPVTFDVAVHEQLPVDQISATALARGAEVRWEPPEIADGAEAQPLLLVFLPIDGDAGIVVLPASTETLSTNSLVVGVEYVAQLTTVSGRPVSPTVLVRPFPSGALDPVPWQTVTDLVPSAGFGASVAFAGLDDHENLEVAVGAPSFTSGTPLGGRVYVYPGETVLTGGVPDTIDGPEPLGMFGMYLAPSEDFDNDGFGDLLAHAPFPFPPPEVTDTGANPAGVIHVVRGGDGAPTLGPSFTGVESDHFGSAALGRDFDGDDHADLFVGGPGAAYAAIVSSSLGVLFTTTSGTATRLGFSVASGDFDADGLLDLAVGEPLYGSPIAIEDTMGEALMTMGGAAELLYQGRVRVYLATGDGVFDPAFIPLVGTTAGQMLGASLAAADVDGDGVDDLLAGSTACAIPGTVTPMAQGSISIWRGGGAGVVFTPAPQKILTAQTLCLGRNVAAGDVNQDGLVDVIGGDSSAGEDGQGELRVFLGGDDGFPLAESSAIGGLSPGASLGRSLAVGDLDQDGRADVLAGAPGSGEMYGSAYLFRGAPRRGPDLEVFSSITGLSLAVTGEFGAQEGPPVKYTCRWSFGDGVTEEASCDPAATLSTSHVYDMAGTYVVRLRVLSADDRFGEAVIRVHATEP